jgi:hypothetical protein
MAKSNLTDGQRVILAAAGARDSGLVLPVPSSMLANRGTLAIILNSLLKRGLVTERPVQVGEESWRQTEDGSRMALVVSHEALDAIGIDPAEHILFAGTDLGRGSVDGGSRDQAPELSQPPSGNIKPAHSIAVAAMPRDGSKLAILIEALQRPAGATLAELTAATGWQPHSVRGAISGALKKKLAIKVVSETTRDRGRVYRIAADEVQQ